MSNSFEIQKFTVSDEAAIACGQALNSALMENLNAPVLLLLSGGSVLKALNEILPEALGEHITISMLDERFSQDAKINNFTQMQTSSFFELTLATHSSIIGTLPRPNETISQFAERIEKSLRAWKHENPNGKILATLGMGGEGHTAGIFPIDNKNTFSSLFENNAWVVGYTAPTKYAERVTTTLIFFENIDEAFALVCGPEKKPAFDRLLKGKEEINLLPAKAWKKIKKVKIFTDIQ